MSWFSKTLKKVKKHLIPKEISNVLDKVGLSAIPMGLDPILDTLATHDMVTNWGKLTGLTPTAPANAEVEQELGDVSDFVRLGSGTFKPRAYRLTQGKNVLASNLGTVYPGLLTPETSDDAGAPPSLAMPTTPLPVNPTARPVKGIQPIDGLASIRTAMRGRVPRAVSRY